MNYRLQQFLSAENLSQAQFADIIGVARASVSHIIAGRNKPGFDFIYSMTANFPNLNVEWLVTGRGKMYKTQTDLFPVESLEAPQPAQIAPAAPQEPQQQNNWMPGHEVLINQADGLLLAAKGGNNGENHNHNDVGNFIIYGNSQPLIIDLGVGAYNDKTFSSHRYEIENTRSAYHNVPIINGEEQQNGSSFGSRNALFNTNGSTTTLTMDIAKAYPTEARVKKWIRTYQQSSSQGITITDDYRLRKFLMPSQIVLICHGKPTLATPGTIRLKSNSGNYELHYDPSELTPDIEKITTLDTSTKNSWKKASIYRILLTINSHAKKGMVTYSITGR